ncbi:hypothetical protein [Nocardioides sp. GXZ039]|uniref:hypothetical protein n=1 Tax=Nocardioides sp. GXZ039 TaxID=3136018 RepID=UPI0030F4195D
MEPEPSRSPSGAGKRRELLVGGVGCLFLLVALPLMAVLVLAIFFDEPLLLLGLVAFLVACAAYRKASRGSS